MTTKVATKVHMDNGNIDVVTWANLETNADEGNGVRSPVFGDKSVQIVGTIGTVSIAIQGSNDGVNWAPLNDIYGTVIALTAATQMVQVGEVPLWIRPDVSSQSSTTDLDVIMVMRRSNESRQ